MNKAGQTVAELVEPRAGHGERAQNRKRVLQAQEHVRQAAMRFAVKHPR
jgi:hypothetical protein